MALSVCINTCSLAPHAQTTLSSGYQPYGERAWFLRTVLLPLYRDWVPGLFREIVVVGEFEEGQGYTYVPCPSVFRSCADALLQRQMGYDALTKSCSWVLFQHDDMLWGPNNVVDPRTEAFVLSPSRWTQARGPAEQLSDGFTTVAPDARTAGLVGNGYVNGHACLVKPHVFREGFKWTDAAPVFQWDTKVTARLKELNIPIKYAPELVTWDMERNAEPWR